MTDKMSDSDIDKLDVGKLHSEANQLLNQRLTITTTAISVVCLVLAWLLPGKNSFTNGGNIGIMVNFSENYKNTYSFNWLIYFGTTFLFVLLGVLFWLSSLIKRNLFFITSYLISEKISKWEQKRHDFPERDKHFKISHPSIFLILGLIIFFYPLIYGLIIKQEVLTIILDTGFVVHTIAGLIFFVVFIYFRNYSKNSVEDILIEQWKNKESKKENV